MTARVPLPWASILFGRNGEQGDNAQHIGADLLHSQNHGLFAGALVWQGAVRDEHHIHPAQGLFGTPKQHVCADMHFIPTNSFSLNQIEHFLALITEKAIRRCSFVSVKQLVQHIDQLVRLIQPELPALPLDRHC